MADPSTENQIQKSQDMKTEGNKKGTDDTLADPKSIQDLAQYDSRTVEEKSDLPDCSQVQTLLQQMQDKFQVMSDQILARNDMGHRIDDLEKNIADLMTQGGIEDSDK